MQRDLILTVAHVGWHKRLFVLPNGSFGQGTEKAILKRPSEIQHAYRKAGTLIEWQNSIAKYAVGDSRLELGISIAFAGPLMQLVGMDGGGFHLRGDTSTGKTTALRMAASVWGGGDLGGYIRRWRTTCNALE
jgi:putative DNA primase/helicase